MTAASHLRALQALELAVRKGSLVAAAEELGVSPAAVGQRVKALEDYLGVELLVRGRSGIMPSPALAAAVPHLRLAFAELGNAAAELELQRGSEVHVAGPMDFVELWLAPRIKHFRARHPQVRFCINGEGDAPLRLGRLDCEVRFGPALEQDGTTILFHDFVVPVSSPANASRTEGAPSAARLEDFPLLHVDFYKDDPVGISWPAWISRNGLVRTAPERGIRFQRIVPAIDAVLADAGFALCGLALLRDHLTAGRISMIYPPAMGVRTQSAFTAYFRGDHERRAPVRAFREWLIQESHSTAEWIDALAGKDAD